MFSELGIPVKVYGDYLLETDRKEIEAIVRDTADADIPRARWRGIAIGEHALAGALRFFGRGSLDGELHANAVARRYLHAALLTAVILDRFLSVHRYDVAVFHHGIYVPQGVVGDVCRMHNVRVVNWHPAYRDRTYLFSHGDTYHRTMIAEPQGDWGSTDWDGQRERRVMDYLESRCTGGDDWISFQRHDGLLSNTLTELGIDPRRPVVGLLTNVMWDARLHFRANSFELMLDWLLFTIDYFSRRPDVQLLIRVHPAEVLGTVPSRQRAEEEIGARWPELPQNIRVVGPDSPINTYSLMRACDTVLVYGTKMAIELPCWGIPVIVAGEAWARGKGFTTDVSSPEEYEQVLDTLPRGKPLEDETVQRARQYAYHIFFRRMIPVKFARRFPYLVPFAYDVRSLSDLALTIDHGLDTICDGILYGRSFIFSEERAGSGQ
jgi:hypothetical protein